MAGSLNHIVNSETGEFNMDLIDNLGDANEALYECFELIKYITGGKMIEVNRNLKAIRAPTIKHDMA